MSDEVLEQKIGKIAIIARALPIQKLRIVKALQKNGEIVAMTGDGVNDAPAIKKADIGISMGITGTDVAKEASKAILVDDNFATIVNGVKEGRNIYDKMIKSAKYLLSCNSGEIFTILFAIILRLPLPLLPLQILLVNLLTDASPALGLGMESPEEDIMKRSPRNPKENPISKADLFAILFFGIVISAGTLYMFYSNIADLPKARTIAFTTLVFFQLFAVFSSRSLHFSLNKLNPFTNMWLLIGVSVSVLVQIIVIYWAPMQVIFGTVALTNAEWLRIIYVSLLGFAIMEISKNVIFWEKNHSI